MSLLIFFDSPNMFFKLKKFLLLLINLTKTGYLR